MRRNNLFGLMFMLTGVFAIAGSLYTWGDGSIFAQTELLKVLIPWADLLLTGPVSLVAGYGLMHNRRWGKVLGLVTSGIYLFGSLLVFITMRWNHHYSVFLMVPALTGFGIGLGYVAVMWKERTIEL